MNEGAGAKFFVISYTIYIAQSIQLEVCDLADWFLSAFNESKIEYSY
jgi:hypothetical protein